MTKAEAAELITSALAAAGPIDNTISADAFAKRAAIALDALGLLDHCALTIEPPVPGDPFGRATTGQGTAATHPDFAASASRAMQEGSTDVPWATTRNRKDPVS